MGIFRRSKEVVVEPQPEEGNANLAKQLKQNQLHIQRSSKKPTKASVKTQQTDKYDDKYKLAPAPVDKASGKPFYQFETLASPHGKRSKKWYVWSGIFFGALIVVNIVIGLYMSAVVLVLLITLLFISASREPKKIKVGFYANGLSIDQEFHPWSELESFWILYEPPGLKEVHFKRNAKIISEVTIQLGEEHPLKIRDLLLPLLPEDQTKEETRIGLVSRTFKL